MFFKTKHKRIFLDYASTTPVAKEVSEVMRETQENFANPSALYGEAIAAKRELTVAREKIAATLGCQKSEIVFTSGGTEGNNLALLGVFETHKTANFTPHIVTTAIEHASVLEVCEEIKRRGGEVTILPVSEEGIVSVKNIRDALKENTVLVSVMFANNEIGTVQPIKEIARAVKEFRQTNKTTIYFHTDACQAALYEELHMQKLGVDMMTLDGIKMYGPRGVGILYVRGNVELQPIVFGGGQESGRRSGTENVVSSVGFAKALQIANDMREKESARLTEIRDYAIVEILKTFPTANLNGSRENRLPNNVNVCFPGLDAEFAVISLDVAGISASYSSSCRTLAEDSSSYVVTALGKENCAASSLRFTFGRETKKSDIDVLVSALQKIMKSIVL